MNKKMTSIPTPASAPFFASLADAIDATSDQRHRTLMTRLRAIAGDIRAVHAMGTQRALRRLARAAITEPEFQAEIRRLRLRAHTRMTRLTVASMRATRIIARQRRVLRAVMAIVVV